MKIFCRHTPIILITDGIVKDRENNSQYDAIYISCRCSKCNKLFAERWEPRKIGCFDDNFDARIESASISLSEDKKHTISTTKYKDKNKKDKIKKYPYPRKE